MLSQCNPKFVLKIFRSYSLSVFFFHKFLSPKKKKKGKGKQNSSSILTVSISSTMKLRLRSLENKETLRLEVPSSCTLHELGETLSQLISSSPSSLRFSLNRKDELHASSPPESLHSLGVTAGDLIFYSRDPYAFVSQTLESETQSVNKACTSRDNDEIPDGKLDKQEIPVLESVEIGVNLQESKSEEAVISQDCGIPDAMLDKQHYPVQESEKIEVSSVDSKEHMSKKETLEFPNTDTMEIDEGSVVMPEPYFLRRVLGEKLGDRLGPHGLVIVAVHEILLESGFVGFDSESGMRIDQFDLPDHLLLKGVSMSYTLPEILNDSSKDVTESVALKYQILGHFVNIYGSLAKGDSGMHKLCLNAYNFGPILSLVWANSDQNCSLLEYKSFDCGKEVFEFWKNVKDGLALPLLIDLCDKAGLCLPACWTHLPTELKLKLLECLPGVDVAKMECVSRDMRYLASNNELWRQKFVEEFGGPADAQGKTNWKERFVFNWEYNRKRKRVITPAPWFPYTRPYFPIIRDPPAPFGGNSLIQGGDYDRYPNIHFPPFPLGQRRQVFPPCIGRRNFAPNCNLGGT